MENRGKIQKGIEGLQRVRTWQLVILLIIFGFVAATFLRLNSIGMVQRREAVLAADKAGNADITLQRLYDLQHYVSSHMNTDLGKGVYLEAGYNRDVQVWQEKYYGDSNPNGNIHKKAQEVCAPKFSSWSPAYIQCTTNELNKYPAAQNPGADTSKPRQEAYIHSFSSPVWSPDFAGWSVLVVGVILLLIVIRILAYGILKLLLNRHYKRV
ncbi:hypothetical protein KI440_00500 [Candidatus Saccharibacteria bacterium TM7i]|nr:hypothetical protein KI440_00500 [Candidatus Saccharibacteria bacterium TM7i]